MGIEFNDNGKTRELVRVVSDNPTHDGYYTTYRDLLQPGDVEYFEAQIGEMSGEPGEGIQLDAGKPPAAPINRKKRK